MPVHKPSRGYREGGERGIVRIEEEGISNGNGVVNGVMGNGMSGNNSGVSIGGGSGANGGGGLWVVSKGA
jgi:hypothetical protein